MHKSIGLTDTSYCLGPEVGDPVHDSAGMSCAPCDMDVPLALGQSQGSNGAGLPGPVLASCSCLSVDGVDVNSDADDVVHDDLEGEAGLELNTARHE